MVIDTFDKLIEFAKSNFNRKVAIVSADDQSVVSSCLRAYKLGLMTPVFVGTQTKPKEIPQNLEWITCKNHTDSAKISVDLWLNGRVDTIMKGLAPTKTVLHEVLQHRKKLIAANIINHLALFHLNTYYKLVGLTDAAINIEPTIQNRIDSIINCSVGLAKIGITKPNIALLSAVEKENKKITSTTEAIEIKNTLENQNFKGTVEGPISLDLAISANAASIKGYNSSIAGKTDLLVVPEIVSGNILYKSLTYLAGANCASVVLGCKAPIILTSRADSEQNKLYSIALGVALS